MEIRTVQAVYFSATNTTKKVVTTVARTLAEQLGVPVKTFDFTLPRARVAERCFEPTDLVVFGTPVYAGRVPNVLLKFIRTIRGNGAVAIPLVVYGNRNFDDALVELRDLLEGDGFHTLSAGAFIGEHSFSRILAAGRPDAQDLEKAKSFALQSLEKLGGIADVNSMPPVEVEGIPYPYRGYYWPKDRQGNPVDIRKVRPKVNENCINCKLCAKVCPMGSISLENVREFSGICLRCGSCVKKCPQQARYYDEYSYHYHRIELEEGFARRAEPSLFF